MVHPEVTAFLKAHEKKMFLLLEKMVCIQSGSRNKKGVDEVSRVIAAVLKNHPLSITFDHQTEVGDHLVVKSRCESSTNGRILLVGHMDTVFPENTEFNWFREDKERVYGPGVADMKGGLVAGIFALKALGAAGLLEKIPITFIFNSDEEIGSKTSRPLIRKAATESKLAFVLEAGGLNGEVVTGRKGSFSTMVKVKGKAGHAAFAGKNKASAILEMAHKTIGFEALNDLDTGITVNVGLVKGGIGPNTVAEDALARVDFRYVNQGDDEKLINRLEAVAAGQNVPGTSTCFDIVTSRPPMPVCKKNVFLFQVVKKAADALGIPINDSFRQGVSDANILADENLPVVDGLGPLGAEDHSDNEYMIKSSLLERTILLANSIYACRDLNPPD